MFGLFCEDMAHPEMFFPAMFLPVRDYQECFNSAASY